MRFLSFPSVALSAFLAAAAAAQGLSESPPAPEGQLELPGGKERKVENVPLPVGGVRMPQAGEENSYKIVVSPALEAAYDAYLEGRTADALAAVGSAHETAGTAIERWHLETLQAQILIQAGEAGNVDDSLGRAAEHEREVFGFDINARALRGEARVWLGDLDGAREDFAQVLRETADWRLKTRYLLPPGNVPELVARTTAQLRAMTGLAGMYLLQGDPTEALRWAAEAEARYNDVHFVSNHGLYGKFVAVHADSFYGRALNLTFLGASTIMSGGDRAAGERSFTAAQAFYDALGYAAGPVTIAALRAWSLVEVGDYDEADRVAGEGVAEAARRGLLDLVWRIEAIRGEALLAAGREADAEAAFRRAQDSIAVISGAQATDRAKRRFGIGKDTVTRRLVAFDAARGDLGTLFADLETGRARAFVDMLAGRAIAGGDDRSLLEEIRSIDADIRRLRVANAAQSGGAPRQDESALLAARAERVAALRTRNPDLAATLDAANPTLVAVQEKLGPGDMILYPLPADATSPVRHLVIRADGAELSMSSGSQEDVLAALQRFADGMALEDSTVQREAADMLHEILDIPAARGEGTLYVVPTGSLYFVPWGALAVDRPVVVLPTAAWVLRAPPANPATRAATVVGDPIFGESLPQLPGAREEARDLGVLYDVEPLVGSAATEASLRLQLGDGAAVLHLATHGIFDARQPLESAIFLTDGEAASPLTAADLYANPLPARLVVLSACETGLGRSEAGDDFLGLTRSFYLAGARSVVNSLWTVDDVATVRYMTVFHETLKATGDAGTAWLAARDALREEGFPPSAYGAFILGGSRDIGG
jgi:tetratricopeptide (TPR) repeat protein